MKELSVEEKAKLYDEAKARMSRAYNDNRCTIGFMNEIFPELKESEDERVRNKLIKFFKGYSPDEEWWGNITQEDILAWLEKQDEHANFRNKIQIGDKVTRNEDGVLVNLSQLKRVAKPAEEYNITGIGSKHATGKLAEKIKELKPLNEILDKQGEQKTVDEIAKEVCKNKESATTFLKSAGIMNEKGELAEQYRQDEQKTTNKVEPKIKAGDWVVCNNGPHHIFQVIERSWPNAKYRNIDGTEIFLNVNTLDKQYHLWTIQDAKDGDVLVDEDNNIGIHKGIEGLYWDSYIYLGCDGKLRGFSIGGSHKQANTRPATKEQRDALIKAMTDAGYTFDFEKKELKKIVAPIFYIGDRVRYKGHACDGVITEITDTDYICGNAKLPISTQDKLELVEQRSAWNEEDENIRLRLIDYLYGKSRLAKDREDGISWLKSIKERVQPQTKQEWSEEDENTLNGIIEDLNSLKQSNPSDISKGVYQEEINWLKSLKDRYTWKPSKEHIIAL